MGSVYNKWNQWVSNAPVPEKHQPLAALQQAYIAVRMTVCQLRNNPDWGLSWELDLVRHTVDLQVVSFSHLEDG